MLSPTTLYARQRAPSEQCLLTLFDLRCPDAEQRLRREQLFWEATHPLAEHLVGSMLGRAR